MFAVVLVSALFVGGAWSDTPANCTYDDIQGTWTFHEGPRGQDRHIQCATVDLATLNHTRHLQLTFPNVAIDLKTGEKGTWTIVYNQGFEVDVGFRRYFAFSKYTGQGPAAVSYCGQTMPGWSHDTYARDWACYFGTKDNALSSHASPTAPMHGDRAYRTDSQFVRFINAAQSSWKAKQYDHWDGMKVDDVVRMMGGVNSRFQTPSKKINAQKSTLDAVGLPDSFDWRDVAGQNFVSPVRNQGGCGSCFAFGSMAMLEARYRIGTNNTQSPVFSPQDVVDCSYYSQGCDGGFPFLIGGKYAEDVGVVLESCDPYTAPSQGNACDQVDKCRRYYATDYKYVGGFYGGCSEELMREAIVKRGPVVIGFEVYGDFMHYSSGIYHHTGLKDTRNFGKFNPFEITNHAVLIVGYGSEGGVPFWSVKNSWGTGWGEGGFFRIRRGTDECGIESLAVESTPMVTY